MDYRLATYADLESVSNLLRYYLQEQWASGDPIIPTNRSVQTYHDLVRGYINGSSFGIVILAEQQGEVVGFVLTGEHPSRNAFDTTLGKVAVVWIAWTHPAHRKGGTALGMLSFGRPHLVAMGFQTATMTVRSNNEQGRALTLAFGAEPAESTYLFPLAEEPAHLRRNDGQ